MYAEIYIDQLSYTYLYTRIFKGKSVQIIYNFAQYMCRNALDCAQHYKHVCALRGKDWNFISNLNYIQSCQHAVTQVVEDPLYWALAKTPFLPTPPSPPPSPPSPLHALIFELVPLTKLEDDGNIIHATPCMVNKIRLKMTLRGF